MVIYEVLLRPITFILDLRFTFITDDVTKPVE